MLCESPGCPKWRSGTALKACASPKESEAPTNPGGAAGFHTQVMARHQDQEQEGQEERPVSHKHCNSWLWFQCPPHKWNHLIKALQVQSISWFQITDSSREGIISAASRWLAVNRLQQRGAVGAASAKHSLTPFVQWSLATVHTMHS